MNDTFGIDSDGPTPRKPRLALMGEFSAGKSTLTNLLLGGSPLPVRVTATRLPPVWISHGAPGAVREDLDGNLIPVDTNDLEAVPLEETRLIRMTMEEDILHLCDLIDMPGISDPNMASEVWERVIGEADNIIWCSHATQAWRQSEAAVWETVPEDLYSRSILLLTRFDKIVSDGDRQRVMSRVRRETRGLFSDFFPVSLTEAMQAGDDRDAWETSGVEAFARRLVEMLNDPGATTHGTYDTAVAAARSESVAAQPEIADSAAAEDEPATEDVAPVVPRRVRPLSNGAGPVTQARRPTESSRVARIG